MTIACLMVNTVRAACAHCRGLPAAWRDLNQQKARRKPGIATTAVKPNQLFQAKATLSRLLSPNRSDERATALPPSAR